MALRSTCPLCKESGVVLHQHIPSCPNNSHNDVDQDPHEISESQQHSADERDNHQQSIPVDNQLRKSIREFVEAGTGKVKYGHRLHPVVIKDGEMITPCYTDTTDMSTKDITCFPEESRQWCSRCAQKLKNGEYELD